MLRAHQRRERIHDQFRDDSQISVALHHAGDAGQVGLQPVLLLVRPDGLAQRLDHGVDVVLELRDLALGLDRDRPGEVAGGHRTGHLGDRADLPGQVPGQLVDVLGQPLPGAGHALDLSLTAQPPLAADLAGHPGDLGGECGQLVDHRVDRGLQLQDLPPRVHVDLAGQVTLCHRRGDLGDVAHLAGQVVGHRVDVVGKVLPGAGDPADDGLTAEVALSADLAGDPGHLIGEPGQLVDHRVQGALQLEHLALGVHRDLLGQVTPGHGRRHFGDVPHLAGEVPGHGVDRIGQVLPGAGHALDVGLAAEAPLTANLAGHPGHFGGEEIELVGHAVEHGGDLVHQRIAGLQQPGAEVPATHRGQARQELLQSRLVQLATCRYDVGHRLSREGRGISAVARPDGGAQSARPPRHRTFAAWQHY